MIPLTFGAILVLGYALVMCGLVFRNFLPLRRKAQKNQGLRRAGACERVRRRLRALQGMFDTALKRYSATELVADGVHPSPLGHQLMAQAWREAACL
jgi:hypothetical protein